MSKQATYLVDIDYADAEDNIQEHLSNRTAVNEIEDLEKLIQLAIVTATVMELRVLISIDARERM